jgi:hypothetical protein
VKKIGDTLTRIEKGLGRQMDRLTRVSRAPRELIQLLDDVVEDAVEHVEPVGGGRRTFPYTRLEVHLAVPPGRGPGAEAVLEQRPGLEERIAERLAAAGCDPPPTPQVTTRILEGVPPESWQDRDFHVEYGRGRSRRRAPAALKAMPPVRLVVIEGDAGRRTHELLLERIEIGRTGSVPARGGRRQRQNQLAFADAPGANASVSRAHAHLEWVAAEEGFRLFDDGSTQGTRIVRKGRTIEVPGAGGRGVRVESGDELQFGKARVRFSTGASAAST